MPDGGAPTSPRRRLLRLWHDHGAWIVLVVALLVTFSSVANHELWTPDEPREAQIGREMLESGWSAMPTLSGEPFVEKPPLFPWAVAASYAMFGVSAAAARVPAALFSALAVLLAFLIGRRIAGSVAGVAAAAVLLTTSKFATTCFFAVNDTALTAFVAGGHLCFVAARDRPKSVGPLLGAGVFASLAFLTKGVIGPILVGGPPVLALAFLREWRTLRAIVPRALVLCGVPVAATAGAWILALAREGGWEVVQESVINNTVARTLGSAGREFGSYGHDKPFWYYAKAFPVALLPWSLALPALWTSRILDRGARPARARYVAALVLGGILLLSIPSGKRTLYFLPLIPAAAAVFGVWVSRVGSHSGSRLDRGTVTGLSGLLAAACAALGAALFWLALVGAPPGKLAVLERSPTQLVVVGGVLALVGALLAGALAFRAWRRCDARVVRNALAVGVLATAVSGLVGRAILDPMEEMRTGSEGAAAVLASSPRLVGLHLGETEAAMLSYYARKPLTNLPSLEQVEALAAEEAECDFAVEVAKRTKLLLQRVRARHELLARVEMRPGDHIEIYRAHTAEAH